MKKRLRELLVRPDFEAIVRIACEKRRTLGLLISSLYDADPLIGWRAVDAIGVVADRLAEDDPDYVREHLRRLYWLLSEESGGICWRAPEAMAEIVRRRPKLFDDYIPIIVGLIVELAEEDLGHLRAGTLWAMGRLGPLAGHHLDDALPAITRALDHTEALTRGLAVWCLGRTGQIEPLAARPALLLDQGTFQHYEDGVLQETSVGDQAQRAIGASSVE